METKESRGFENTRSLARSLDIAANVAGALVVATLIVYALGTTQLWISFRRAGIPATQALSLQNRQYLLHRGISGLALPALWGAAWGAFSAWFQRPNRQTEPRNLAIYSREIDRLVAELTTVSGDQRNRIHSRLMLEHEAHANAVNQRRRIVLLVMTLLVMALALTAKLQFRSWGSLAQVGLPAIVIWSPLAKHFFAESPHSPHYLHPRIHRFVAAWALLAVAVALLGLLDGPPRIDGVRVDRSDRPGEPITGLLVGHESAGWNVAKESSILFIPDRLVETVRIDKAPPVPDARTVWDLIGLWWSLVYLLVLIAAMITGVVLIRRHHRKAELENRLQLRLFD